MKIYIFDFITFKNFDMLDRPILFRNDEKVEYSKSDIFDFDDIQEILECEDVRICEISPNKHLCYDPDAVLYYDSKNELINNFLGKDVNIYGNVLYVSNNRLNVRMFK